MQKSSLRPQCSTPLLTGVLVLCVVFLLCASVTAHNEKCFSESNLLQSKVNQEEEIPFHSSLDVAENVIRDYVTIRVLRTSTAVDRILDLQEKSTPREQDPMPTDVSVPNDGTKLSVAKRKLFPQLRSRLLNMNCIVSHSSYRLVLSMMRWEGDTFPVELHVQTSGGTLSLKSAAFPNVATNIEVHMDILEMSLIESLTVLFGAPELLQTIHVRLLLAPILPMIPSLKPSPSLTMYEVFRIIHESNATELRRGGESELVKLLTSVGWDPLHIFMVSVHESDVVMDAAQLAALPHSSTQSRFGSEAVTSLQFTTVLSLPKDANVTLIPSLPPQLETVNVVGFSFAAAAKCTASNGACSVTVCIRANATCKTHPKLLDRSCKYFPSEMFQAATSTTAHDPRSATEAESQSTSTSRSSQTTTEIPIQYEVLVPVSQRRPLGAVEVLLLLDSGSRLQSLYIRPISFRIFTEPVQGTFPYLVGAGGEVPTSSNAPPWSIAVLVLFLLSSLIGTTGLGLFLWQRYEHQKQTLQSSLSCYDSAYYGASGSRDRPDHYYTHVAPFSHDWNTAEPISNVALAPPTKENHDSANSNLNLLFEEFTDEEGSDDDTWAQTKKAKKKKGNKKTTKKPKSVTTTAKSKTQKKAPETENSKSKPNESEPHTRAPSGSPKLVMPIATEKRESLLQVDLDDEIEDVEDIDC